MNTLNGPIWSRCSIALTYPARSHFQRTLNRERWVQGWDERNCSSRQEEEWGEEDGQEKDRRREKTGDRFKKCCVLPFGGRSGCSTAKKWLVRGECPGNWKPREGKQPF